MIIAVLTYKIELSEVEKHLEKHRMYLDKYYSSGKFIASGAQNPRIGGIILMNTTKDDAQILIKEDPFFRNNIAEYELIEFSPTKYQVGFEQFIKR
ncbi:YciI family protein [Dysgonomonas sp. BGC7]|uniref:YciI family protein n=1 Tax=Dysgonomonas sp. BGC7 TaxID=1658008 RepID=UPI0006825294|nr:YciI family protein [Dysgonomonas sp. BGC7]MBD8387114.1 GTP cyclohydrolase [Dysgonomonas sp. BGC7]